MMNFFLHQFDIARFLYGFHPFFFVWNKQKRPKSVITNFGLFVKNHEATIT